jgi:hypothetical protein
MCDCQEARTGLLSSRAWMQVLTVSSKYHPVLDHSTTPPALQMAAAMDMAAHRTSSDDLSCCGQHVVQGSARRLDSPDL